MEENRFIRAVHQKCLPRHYRYDPLKTEDLHRFDMYAFKIHELHVVPFGPATPAQVPPEFKNDTTGKSWADVWKEIRILRPTPQFLPNLRRIRFELAEEQLLLPLVGLPGSKLSYLRIVDSIRRLPGRQVRRVLAGIEDISKLEHLHICDEEPDVFPAKFIERAPLKHLRLWPKENPFECKPQQYTQLGLRTEILKKSTLEKLVLGLNRDWCTPEIEALGGKATCAGD